MSVEFVGIELELRGEEGVYSDLRKIQSLMNSLVGRKKVDAGLQKARRQIVAYRGELEKLQRAEKANRNNANWTGTTAQIQEVKNKMRDAQQAVREFSLASRQAGQTFTQMANSVASRVRQIGSSMQSLGNAMQRITSPFSRITTGLLYGVGYKALNTITEGFSGAFERYDTMQTYTKALKEFGFSTDEADVAIRRLEESVLGLPTGLDEIVAVQKRFVAASGDINKSTDMAIAFNNALLASNADARQALVAQRIMTQLGGGAQIASTSWDALQRAIPLVFTKLAEESKMGVGEYMQALKRGQKSTEEFIEEFNKIGTEGAIQGAANVMKTTFSGLFANIQNATKRMGEGILKSLDDAFTSYNGRNFIQNLLGVDAEGNVVGDGIRHWIDDISNSVQNWIKANPDKIIDFFNELKKIDIKGLIKGVARGMKDMLGFFEWIMKFIGGDNIEDIGRKMVWVNMIGRVLSTLGGVVRGLAIPIGYLHAFGVKIGSGGILGKLAKLIGLGGNASATSSISAITKASGSLVRFSKNVGLIAASVAAIGGAGFVAFRSLKTIIKDLREIAQEVNSFTPSEWETTKNTLWAMAAAISTFAVAADAIGIAVGSLASIATAPTVIGGAVIAITGALGALVAAETMSIFKSFELSTRYLKSGLENLSGLSGISVNTGNVTDALTAMREVLSAFDASYYEGGSAKEGGGKSHSDWSALASSFKGTSGNIYSAVTNIKATINELLSLPEFSSEDVDAVVEKATSVIDAMKEIAKEVNLKFDTGVLDFLGGGTSITEGSTSRGGSIARNISAMIGSISSAVQQLSALQTLEVDLETAKNNAVEIGTKMGEIFSALNEAFGQVVSTEQDIEGVGKISGSYNEGVTKGQVKASERMNSLLSSYQAVINSIIGIYNSLVGGEGDTSFDSTKFSEIMSHITGEGGILAQLKSMYDMLISESEGFGGEASVDILSVTQGFASAIENIKQAMTKLQEVGAIDYGEGGVRAIANTISTIKTAISRLKNSFSADAIAGLKAQVDLFVQSINGAFESLSSLNQEISINATVKLSEAFGASVSAVVQKINEGKATIRKTRRAVNFTIPVNVRFSLSTNLGSVLSSIAGQRARINSAGRAYTGGYIGRGGRVLYRSRGGDIYAMKPRGTDTVPAMLTPGEYVHRKRAVDFFGVDFMRRINNLDIGGAMSELMRRAGYMADVGRQTIINNTYNNNANVTINNGAGAGEGFTYKSASRFAGAF